MITTIISIGLSVFVAIWISKTVYENWYRRRFILEIWREFKFIRILETFGVLLLVVIAAILLNQVTWLSYGYMHLVYPEGGSVISSAVGDPNVTHGVAWMQIGSICFLLLFGLAVPFLAEIEEQMFRDGVLEHKKMIKKSLLFGIVHCIMGVSLGTAIAISIAGYFFAVKYRKHYYKTLDEHTTSEFWSSSYGKHRRAETKALKMSTAYHSIYNMIIIIFSLAYTIYSLL